MFLSRYHAVVFDCDGVIMNSNRLKTLAFYDVARPYGEEKARELVAYHIRNGGVSRNIKFEFFIRDVLGREVTKTFLSQFLEAYGREVKEGLLNCEIADGLRILRKATPHARWMVVSGGNQSELRHVLAMRQIDQLFDAGIYGSPANKEIILSRAIDEGILSHPALYVGDSRYDHEVATSSGLDFIFVSGWTDFDEWESYCQLHKIPSIKEVADLLRIEENLTAGKGE